MRLNDEQVAEYRDKGWILLPSVFSAKERSVLEAAAFEVLERPGPEVAREDDGSPHVCWGMHLFDERFGALTRHPRMLAPVGKSGPGMWSAISSSMVMSGLSM